MSYVTLVANKRIIYSYIYYRFILKSSLISYTILSHCFFRYQMQPAFDSRHYSCNALRQQNSKSAMLCNNQVKKAFSCPFENCLFSYKEKRALQDHINLHTGMQPYICNYCNYSTTHRTTLIQHKKHKHCQTVRNSSYGS